MNRLLPLIFAAALAGCQGLPPQPEPLASQPTSAKAQVAPWEPLPPLKTAPSLANGKAAPPALMKGMDDMKGMKGMKGMKNMKGMEGME